MARRSYLPTEVHWGHKFEEIIEKPPPGSDDARYIINLNKFHNVVPQEGLPLLTPSELSQLVVNRAKRTVPYPLLGENTLVLSDLLCVCPNERGQPCLMARTADTYPNQMLEITVRMYLYRWRQSSEQGKSTFTQYNLECGYESGEDRLYLRLPTEVYHVIDEGASCRAQLPLTFQRTPVATVSRARWPPSNQPCAHVLFLRFRYSSCRLTHPGVAEARGVGGRRRL
jgi:hypothetical protein